MGIKLRDYHETALNKILEALFIEHKSRSLVSMVAGSGRHAVIMALCERLALKGLQVLIVASRKADADRLLSSLKKQVTNYRVNSCYTLADIDSSSDNTLTVTTEAFLSKHIDDGAFNLYGCLIFDEMRLFGKRVDSILSGFDDKQLIVFNSILNDKTRVEFGEPVFSYSYSDGVADGHYKRVKVQSSSNQIKIHNENTAVELVNYLSLRFIKKGRKIIYDDGIGSLFELLWDFNSSVNGFEIIFLSTTNDNFRERLGYFMNSKRPVIAICDKTLLTGVDIVGVNEICFTSKMSQLLIASGANKLHRSKGSDSPIIWDFGGNLNTILSIYPDAAVTEISDFEHEEVGQQESADVEITKVDQKQVQPIADKPAKIDLLGRNSLVHVLKGIIGRDENKHLVIALFAHWGGGKSSVIELLRNKFSKPDGDASFFYRFKKKLNPSSDTSVIVFNAWRDEHSLSMSASVANAIIDDLYESRSLFDRILLNVTRAIWKDRFSYSVMCICIFLFLFLYMFHEGASAYFSGVKTFSIVGCITLLLAFPLKAFLDHPFTKKIKELSKKRDFSSSVGLMGEIREDLSELFEVYPPSLGTLFSALLGGKKFLDNKYLLVVDDLDRCSGKKIVEMLEVVQLLVDIENISVLLAVDQEVLLHAVASKYRKQRVGISANEALDMARDYLGKIFQLTITLDKPSREVRAVFVKKMLFESVSLEELSSGSLINTPKYNDVNSDLLDDFEDDNIEDEIGVDYEESEEYLENSEVEYIIFNECVDVFSISNPRCLLRMHNSLTLIKGLYPIVIDNGDKLKIYVFFIFWFESFYSGSNEYRALLNCVLSNDEAQGQTTHRFYRINELFKEMNLAAHSAKEVALIKYRVRNVTLPYLQVDEIPGKDLTQLADVIRVFAEDA